MTAPPVSVATCHGALKMIDVRYWPIADIYFLHRECPLLGVKRTWRWHCEMSARPRRRKRLCASALAMAKLDIPNRRKPLAGCIPPRIGRNTIQKRPVKMRPTISDLVADYECPLSGPQNVVPFVAQC